MNKWLNLIWPVAAANFPKKNKMGNNVQYFGIAKKLMFNSWRQSFHLKNPFLDLWHFRKHDREENIIKY